MPITQNKWALNPGVTNKINWKFKLFQHLGMIRPWLGVQPLPWPGDWSLTMSSSAERNTQLWRRESQRWAALIYHQHKPLSTVHRHPVHYRDLKIVSCSKAVQRQQGAIQAHEERLERKKNWHEERCLSFSRPRTWGGRWVWQGEEKGVLSGMLRFRIFLFLCKYFSFHKSKKIYFLSTGGDLSQQTLGWLGQVLGGGQEWRGGGGRQ